MLGSVNSLLPDVGTQGFDITIELHYQQTRKEGYMRNVSNNRGDTPRPGNGRSIDYLQGMVCPRGYLSLPLQEFIFLYTIPFRSNAELFLRRIVTRDPHFDGSTNTSTTVHFKRLFPMGL